MSKQYLGLTVIGSDCKITNYIRTSVTTQYIIKTVSDTENGSKMEKTKLHL